MLQNNRQKKASLNIFLLCVAILLIIGGFFIYSSSSVYAFELYKDSHYYLKRHLMGIIVGLFALCVLQLFSSSLLRRMSPFLFLASAVLTAFTLLPQLSSTIHGSARWLSILGFTFQPSELLKIGLIFYNAFIISSHESKKKTREIRGYIPILVSLGIVSAILLKQPDFGLTITLCTTIFTLLFIAQYHIRYLLYTILSGIPTVIILVLIKPYRLRRIITYLNPWKDPQGSGFQIIQSLIAIGSGGFGGLGIAQSKQKFFYLPMQHTDFIFSIIAEETGFIGCAFLLIVFIIFLYTGLQIALSLTHRFASLVTFGFVLLISFQSVINIAVATGLLPTKGIGLPFISYGNSALVAHLIMIGIIVIFVREEQ
jgi:cell division protein FtsW